MATLQLRLDPNTRLGDLAKDIITGFETVMVFNKQPLRWGHRDRSKLTRMVRARLSRAVRAYTPCGKKSRCTVDAAPLNHPANMEARAPRYNESILLLREDLPQLCLQIETAVFQRFYAGVGDSIWLPLKPELDRVVEETMTPVLYTNPSCEGCSLCTEETRHSPWSMQSPSPKRRKNIR